MAGSSADSFEYLSLVPKRSICELLLLLNRANHSPLKTSLCRFPGWLVCGFYCCSLVSRSSGSLSLSLVGLENTHPQGGPPDRGTSQGLEAGLGPPREGTQNIRIHRHGFQQVL